MNEAGVLGRFVPDFGKIVSGHTHIDIWGGWQQQARAIYQTVQGVRGENNAVQGGKSIEKSPFDVMLEFMGNRLSPQLSKGGPLVAAATPQSLKDMLPDPIWQVVEKVWPDYRAPGFNLQTAKEVLTPLWVQDVADAIKYDGTKAGLTVAPLAFLGVGTQAYAGPSAASDTTSWPT